MIVFYGYAKYVCHNYLNGPHVRSLELERPQHRSRRLVTRNTMMKLLITLLFAGVALAAAAPAPAPDAEALVGAKTHCHEHAPR